MDGAVAFLGCGFEESKYKKDMIFTLRSTLSATATIFITYWGHVYETVDLASSYYVVFLRWSGEK